MVFHSILSSAAYLNENIFGQRTIYGLNGTPFRRWMTTNGLSNEKYTQTKAWMRVFCLLGWVFCCFSSIYFFSCLCVHFALADALLVGFSSIFILFFHRSTTTLNGLHCCCARYMRTENNLSFRPSYEGFVSPLYLSRYSLQFHSAVRVG